MMRTSEVEVQVARLDRLHPHEAFALLAVCDAEEHHRAARLPTTAQMRRSLLARGLLRVLLAEHVGAAPGNVALHRDTTGKLRLLGPSDVRFNLSHSRDLAVYAVSRGRDVGVDVEALDDDLDIDPILRRFFPAGEAAQLLPLHPAHRRRLFFRSWCRREALLKAQASGLRRGLHDVAAPPPAVPATVPTPFPGDGGWSVVDLDVAAGFAAAVVTTGHDWTPSLARYQSRLPGAPTPSSVHPGRAGSEES